MDFWFWYFVSLFLDTMSFILAVNFELLSLWSPPQEPIKVSFILPTQDTQF